MVIEVGVLNAAPVYALGLQNLARSNGYTFKEVEDVEGWAGSHQPAVLLVDIRNDGDVGLVVDLKEEHPRSVVVALVGDANPETVAACIASGASGAITRDASPPEVTLALRAALTENAMLPLHVARSLVATRPLPGDRPTDIGDEELGWLQSLARSATVATIGREAGYSEREMYRRLKRIYKKMGVRSRTEALLKASRLGWINPVAPEAAPDI